MATQPQAANANAPECDHFWFSGSPAGSSRFVRLCSTCGGIDPDALNRDYAEHRLEVAEEIAVRYEAEAARHPKNHVQNVTWRAAARMAREVGRAQG